MSAPTASPLLPILRCAHAARLPVQIIERIEVGGSPVERWHPAAPIARLIEGRRGAVVVTGARTRIRVATIVSVTVEAPGRATAAQAAERNDE